MRLRRPSPRLALLLVTTASALLLDSCRGKESAPAPTAADVTGDLDEGAVMTFLFGNYDPAKRRSVVGGERPAAGPTQPASAATKAEEEEPENVASLIGLFPFPEGSPERVIALAGASPEGYDAHGQQADVSGALFEKATAGWRAVARTDAITELGSYGRAPVGKLVKLGPGRFGVEFRPGFSNSGVTSGGYSLITEVDGALIEVLSLSGLDEENAGSCDEEEKDCYAWSSAVSYEPGSNPAWLEVVVRTKGTTPGDGGERKVEPLSEESRWSFSDGKYRAVE